MNIMRKEADDRSRPYLNDLPLHTAQAVLNALKEHSAKAASRTLFIDGHEAWIEVETVDRERGEHLSSCYYAVSVDIARALVDGGDALVPRPGSDLPRGYRLR